MRKAFRGAIVVAWVALVGCSEPAGAGADAGSSPQPDAGAALDAGARPDAGGSAVDGGDTSEKPGAYGIFQLYGDEYGPYRQAVGQTLEQYWAETDQRVAELGVTYTRTNTLLTWEIVEPTIGGGYVWDNATMKTDAVVKATYAPATGKQMDLLLVLNPARRDVTGQPFEVNPTAWQAFVRAAVERYDGDGVDDADGHVRVRDWQVMNEPSFDLASGKLTAAQYASLVKLTAQAIHDADPGARVVLGDLQNNLAAVVGLLNDAQWFDAMDTHFWASGTTVALPFVKQMRTTLDSNGYSAAEIWMCEFGTYVHKPAKATLDQSEADQARWLVQAMVANRAAGVSRILWNNLVGWANFAGDPTSQFNFMGLVSSGTLSGDTAADLGRKRLSYFAYQRLIANTETDVATLVGEKASVAGAKVYELQTLAGAKRRYVAWAVTGTPTASLPCASTTVKVQALVPAAGGAFADTTAACASGQVSVALTANPVLVLADE